MTRNVAVIDQGSTSTKGALIDETGEMLLELSPSLLLLL